MIKPRSRRRPVAKRPLHEDVTAGIRRLIRQRSLRAGDRLPTENELAKRFGVSRTSVREATKALAFFGIVESARKRGLTVGRVDLGRIASCLGFHFEIAAYPDAQLLRTRCAIELGSLPFIAEAMKVDTGLYARLYAHTAHPDIIADPGVYIECDLAFHTALIEASGIAPLTMITEVLRSFFERFGKRAAGDAPKSRESGVALHRKLLTLLRDDRVPEAYALVRHSFVHYETTAGAAAPGSQP